MRAIIFTTLLCLTISAQSPTASYAASPVVVEFFESPSCSPAGDQDHGHSHPGELIDDHPHPHPPEKFEKTFPAITFQNVIARHPEAIALTCKIDYSRYDKTVMDQRRKKIDDFCSNRRYGYRKALKFSDRRVSPNILINAKYETNGEMDNVLRSAINLAAAETDVQPLQLSLRDGHILDMTLPKLRLNYPADIWLFTYENTGNIITDFKQLPPWDGRYTNLSLPLHDMKNKNIAVLAQDPTNAKLLAAGKIER